MIHRLIKEVFMGGEMSMIHVFWCAGNKDHYYIALL